MSAFARREPMLAELLLRGPREPGPAPPRPARPARLRSTNSSGVCAPPPRGPRPSTVSAIDSAKWLASLAPPRGTPTIGRPRRLAASAISGAVAASESIPGQRRSMCARSETPSSSGATDPSTASNASRRLARRSKISSPAAGTTLKASPERITVGTALSCSGPAGSCSPATARAVSASASSALRPWSGALPECAARPAAVTRSVPAALRRTTTPSAPSAVRSPASKHRQAS